VVVRCPVHGPAKCSPICRLRLAIRSICSLWITNGTGRTNCSTTTRRISFRATPPISINMRKTALKSSGLVGWMGSSRPGSSNRPHPANSPLRAKYVLQLQDMLAGLAPLQGTDGLWKPGLLDAADYPLSEISGSAFFTYAMAYGVNHGLLPRKTYEPIIQKAWAGMISHVYADGRLGCIQPVRSCPWPSYGDDQLRLRR